MEQDSVSWYVICEANSSDEKRAKDKIRRLNHTSHTRRRVGANNNTSHTPSHSLSISCRTNVRHFLSPRRSQGICKLLRANPSCLRLQARPWRCSVEASAITFR
ncbi:hypothetical protein TRVL_10054 [Trypanosoma vivax]|nr:hypothetical protein TRVL_10054 [Trypanosoma vivax]